MKKRQLSKEEAEYIGPNCAYDSSNKLSHTGRTWQEVHSRHTQNRTEILNRKGLTPTLENLYNLGDDYVSNRPSIRVYDPLTELLEEKERKKLSKKTRK